MAWMLQTHKCGQTDNTKALPNDYLKREIIVFEQTFVNTTVCN